MNPGYYAIARRRLEGQLPLFTSGAQPDSGTPAEVS
jgi:hypothetical protein